MKNVSVIYSQQMNIEDIHGIENLADLKEVYLSDNKITDITPLSSLIALEKLFLDNNQISNITPLLSLKDLKILNLQNNKINVEEIKKLKEVLPNCDFKTTNQTVQTKQSYTVNTMLNTENSRPLNDENQK